MWAPPFPSFCKRASHSLARQSSMLVNARARSGDPCATTSMTSRRHSISMRCSYNSMISSTLPFLCGRAPCTFFPQLCGGLSAVEEGEVTSPRLREKKFPRSMCSTKPIKMESVRPISRLLSRTRRGVPKILVKERDVSTKIFDFFSVRESQRSKIVAKSDGNKYFAKSEFLFNESKFFSSIPSKF